MPNPAATQGSGEAARADARRSPIAEAHRSLERPVHEYTIPEALQTLAFPGEEPVRSVGLVELLADEQKQVVRRVGNDRVNVGNELIVQALAAVNGTRVGVADGSADRWWSRMHPKIRDLVAEAYDALHNNRPEDVQSFLSSRRVVSRS